MPPFKCSINTDDNDDDRMLKKLQALNKPNPPPKTKSSHKKRMEDKNQLKISPIGIPFEVIFDHVVKYLDIGTAHKKLRLVSRQWNDIILGNDEDYSVEFEIDIDFSRQQFLSKKFYSTAERGFFKNVTKLTMKALPQGMKKTENRTLIPGKTIVTRGYKENVGGSVLKFFPNLKVLNLNENEIPEEKFNWLLDLKSNQLEELYLEGNDFKLKTCEHISSCENLQSLTVLNLSHNQLTDAGCKLLSQSVCLQNLKNLNISSTDSSLDGLMYISNATFSCNLTILRANNNNLSDAFHQRITNGEFKFKSLQTFSIRNCEISQETQTQIAKDKKLISTTLDRILL
ncbi:predicted protein [Naegleria gruberi]|uniref:Predicted protein n=1 Tax=Naegleria gruberi TaxID=5762 RepID=D2VQU8_NAEGR|nr:uncharacterized protein NAEGRDRAFT_51528 [Naegleria gruberi]EFC40701.1 predicted protein [Naegleria gruberi]|eukprot:XP_002673445.1 predicted protein [Naegleria gruberi strain NEG-M]